VLVFATVVNARKLFLLLVIFCCLGTLRADVSEGYYPLGCFYVGEDQIFLVVGAKGNRAIAKVDGKEVRVGLPDIRFGRLDSYKAGFIEIVDASGYTLSSFARTVTANSSGGNAPNRGHVRLEFVSEQAVKDGYALIVSGTKAGLKSKDPDEIFLSFQSLGDLEAGKTYKERLVAWFVNDADCKRDQFYFVVFFEGGLPIRSNYDAAISEFFDQRKQNEFDQLLRKYLRENSEASVKHKAHYVYQPVLPRALAEETGSFETRIVLQIASDGAVVVESFVDLDHLAVESFLRDRIEEWKFYPQLIKGQPVATRTATKLKFD